MFYNIRMHLNSYEKEGLPMDSSILRIVILRYLCIYTFIERNIRVRASIQTLSNV